MAVQAIQFRDCSLDVVAIEVQGTVQQAQGGIKGDNVGSYRRRVERIDKGGG